jgi:hypothetical protein
MHGDGRAIDIAAQSIRRADVQAHVPMSHLAVTDDMRIRQKGNRGGQPTGLHHAWGGCWPRGTRYRCPWDDC